MGGAGPHHALEGRFGFIEGQAAGRWVADTLDEHWGFRIDSCERIVRSGGNALAWVGTPSGRLLANLNRPHGVVGLATVAGMLIALLAVLGVDVAVLAALLVLLLVRRRWVSRQPGAFRGAIRIVAGEAPGLGGGWNRGFGRWVRDVLIWTKGPLLFRNTLVAVTGVASDIQDGEPGALPRVGTMPVVIPLTVDNGARLQIATAAASRDRAFGPFPAGPNVDIPDRDAG